MYKRQFYDFVRKDYRKVLADKNVREKDFDVDEMCIRDSCH